MTRAKRAEDEIAKFFFSSRRRHTRYWRDWSSDVCSSDLALPSDGLSRFVRAGAWAAMASGLALIVSMLLAWLVVPYERLGQTEAYLTSSYSVSSGLRLLGFVLLVWGLIGIYGPQSRAAGTFGLWTFVAVFLCTALAVGNVWAEVFVYPTLAQVAPDMLSGAGFGTEAAAYMARGLTLSY